jgi:hypothetical protein
MPSLPAIFRQLIPLLARLSVANCFSYIVSLSWRFAAFAAAASVDLPLTTFAGRRNRAVA